MAITGNIIIECKKWILKNLSHGHISVLTTILCKELIEVLIRYLIHK